jgi:hypothetical protein
MKATVGGLNITKHDSNFAYISYVQDLLERSAANRAEVLEGNGFYIDDSHQMNSFAYDAQARCLKNSGAESRLRRFAGCQPKADKLEVDWKSSGGVGEFFGPLNLDLSDLNLGIIPGLDVNLTFALNEPRFFLQADIGENGTAKGTEPTYEVEDFQVLVLIRTLPPDNLIQLTRPLTEGKKSTAQQYTQMSLTPYTIPKGSTSWNQENFLGSNYAGKRIILGFVQTRAFQGDYALSPYCFSQEWGTGTDLSRVQSIAIYMDGENADGFDVYNPSLRISTRVFYQRFLRFLGTSDSKVSTSGISFNDYASDGGYVNSIYIL